MSSRLLFLACLGLCPGVLTALCLLPYYSPSPVSPRYAFLCVSRKQERSLSRRLKATWAETLTRRYRVLHTGELVHTAQTAHRELCAQYEFRLRGEVVVLDSEQLFVYMLPTGDAYVSSGMLKGLDLSQVKWLLAHQLAHVHLRHAQEHLSYSHIGAALVAWLHRNNHHTTAQLGSYLVHDYAWTAREEQEAELFAMRLSVQPERGKPLCVRGLRNVVA